MPLNKYKRIDLVIGLIFLVYSIGRLVTALPALNKPRELADTTAYLRISRQPIFDIDFWGSTRPFVFPMLLKFAHQDVRSTALIQLGFSILVWGFLAFMITRFLRTGISRLFTFGLILAFSLDRHIAGWDFVMMTESLSVSLLILFIALGLWLLEGWQWLRVGCLCIAGFLLAFTRDTNAWVLLMLAGLLLIAIIFKWIQPRALIVVISLTITFLLSNANANLGTRWVFPLGNLIGRRVLPDEPALQYFEACGMPVSPNLMRLLGEYANAEERAMFEDPELAPFRTWLFVEGKTCYMRWLISNPMHSLGETYNEFEGLITFPEVDKYFARAYDPLMPVLIGKFFYPERFAQWIWIITTLAALAAIWKQLWRENPLWVVFICLNLLVFPHLFLSWHGDAMAPQRHALLVGVQLYLAFWMLIIVSVEYLWFGRQINQDVEGEQSSSGK
jgi:hypothetical protein